MDTSGFKLRLRLLQYELWLGLLQCAGVIVLLEADDVVILFCLPRDHSLRKLLISFVGQL